MVYALAWLPWTTKSHTRAREVMHALENREVYTVKRFTSKQVRRDDLPRRSRPSDLFSMPGAIRGSIDRVNSCNLRVSRVSLETPRGVSPPNFPASPPGESRHIKTITIATYRRQSSFRRRVSFRHRCRHPPRVQLILTVAFLPPPTDFARFNFMTRR